MTQKQYHFGAAHTLIAFKVGQPLGYSPRSFSFTPNTMRLSPVSQCVFIFFTCLRFVHVFQYASLYLLRFRMKQITLRAFWICRFNFFAPALRESGWSPLLSHDIKTEPRPSWRQTLVIWLPFWHSFFPHEKLRPAVSGDFFYCFPEKQITHPPISRRFGVGSNEIT